MFEWLKSMTHAEYRSILSIIGNLGMVAVYFIGFYSAYGRAVAKQDEDTAKFCSWWMWGGWIGFLTYTIMLFGGHYLFGIKPDRYKATYQDVYIITMSILLMLVPLLLLIANSRPRQPRASRLDPTMPHHHHRDVVQPRGGHDRYVLKE